MKPTRDAVHEHVLRTLSEFEPMSVIDYAESANLNRKAARARLEKAWDAKMIHISGYIRRNGSHRPLYAIGSIPDAPALRRITEAESSAKYKQTAKGQAAEKRARKKQADKNKEARRINSPKAEKLRQYGRERERRLFGHRPRFENSKPALDEIAMQFGITWRFQNRRERKAA